MTSPDNGYRDRVVTSLLAADPSLAVLRWDGALVVLTGTTTLYRVLVVAAPEDVAEDRLRAGFEALVKTVTQGSPPTHFLVVGGGAEIAAALKRAAPTYQAVVMGFHQIDERRAIVHVTGMRLGLLERALAGVDELEPLDRGEIDAALARGQAFAQQTQLVASRLSGRNRVTLALLAACGALLLLSYLWGPGGLHTSALHRMGADRGLLVRHGEVWRLLASAFLHAEWVHFAVNMVALWAFGPVLETVLGPRRYLLLYGASALGGALASALSGDHWSVGASGAIWGLMAAGMGLALRPRGVLPAYLALGMRRRLVAPLIINLVYSLRPGIDMGAHLGGGVVGFLLTATVLTSGLVPLAERATPADAERSASPLLTGAAAATVAAMAISVVVALVTGRPWETNAAPVLTRTAIGDTGLTLEVPSAVAGAPEVEDGKSSRSKIYSFGHSGDAPVVFEVIVVRRSAEVPAGQMEAFMDQARPAMEEHAPPKAVRKGPARRVTVGGHPAVVVNHTINGLEMETYLEVVGAFEVYVRGYAGPDRPASWAGIEEKVAATLAPAGPAAP